MAALALMTIACSNDNELKPQQPTKTDGIPFIATISGNGSAVTRALSENNEGNIVATWTQGEQVALIYNVGERKCNTTATVQDVDDEGTATITADLDGSTEDGTEVTIIYPASAVDPDTYDVKSDLLEDQAGTLEYISQNLDLHIGTGKLSIDGVATLQKSVKLEGQLAIFNLTLSKITSHDDGAFTKLVVSFDDDNDVYHVAGSVNIPQNTNQFCVALRPGTILPEFPMLWFEATTTAGKKYINHGKANEVHIAANKYYHTTVSLATIGDAVLTDGKFATKSVGTNNANEQAVIAYVGKVDKYFNRFLALGLKDVSQNGQDVYLNWTKALALNGGGSKTYAQEHPITINGTKYENSTTSTYYDQSTSSSVSYETREGNVLKGWRLPSATDWHYVFEGLSYDCEIINRYCGKYNDSDELMLSYEETYWSSTQNNSSKAWCCDFYPMEVRIGTESVTNTAYVRAVFAY